MLTIDKDEFFTCEYEARKEISPSINPDYYDNLAYNFFQLHMNSVQLKPDNLNNLHTHVMFGMLSRGPTVNKSTDCINGSYPVHLPEGNKYYDEIGTLLPH